MTTLSIDSHYTSLLLLWVHLRINLELNYYEFLRNLDFPTCEGVEGNSVFHVPTLTITDTHTDKHTFREVYIKTYQSLSRFTRWYTFSRNLAPPPRLPFVTLCEYAHIRGCIRVSRTEWERFRQLKYPTVPVKLTVKIIYASCTTTLSVKLTQMNNPSTMDHTDIISAVILLVHQFFIESLRVSHSFVYLLVIVHAPRYSLCVPPPPP